MCELLGFSASQPTEINTLVSEFFSHGKDNPHGWGMMSSGGMCKRCERSDTSRELKKLVKKLPPQKCYLGHIRFATVGSIKNENCHPFCAKDITGRCWTLIHNGTIYSASKLIPFVHHQSGDTDSERLFLYLMQLLDKAQKENPLDEYHRCELIDDFVRDLSPRNKLNLMIFDGELLYIHKNMKQTMKYRQHGAGVIFSTNALDDAEWKDVPTAQLLVYKDGKLIFEGKRHDAVFVPTLQYINANDAMHI